MLSVEGAVGDAGETTSARTSPALKELSGVSDKLSQGKKQTLHSVILRRKEQRPRSPEWAAYTWGDLGRDQNQVEPWSIAGWAVGAGREGWREASISVGLSSDSIPHWPQKAQPVQQQPCVRV